MKQSGFSLIMAIFLIVVLGGIAVFIGRVSTMQHHSSALDEEGAMAYQAARAGIEWGVYRAIVIDDGSGSSCSSAFTLPIHITATSTVNYSVTVACTSTPATEGSTAIGVYQIIATARNTAAGNFAVERQLSATVSK
ncbi:MAG TPA: hypothetical protein VIF10_06305 [Methylobacter sp.]|jgi:MSHA biogenesis protein MshP